MTTASKPPDKGIKGCAVCGFICAAGCCACEHWQYREGVEICFAVFCTGHSLDACERREGIMHFDLFIEGYETAYGEWGFAGAFLDDLVAEHHAESIFRQDGYRMPYRMEECEDVEHSRFRLNKRTLTTCEESQPVIDEIARWRGHR